MPSWGGRPYGLPDPERYYREWREKHPTRAAESDYSKRRKATKDAGKAAAAARKKEQGW